ncbi:putative prophage major tail sheath protein [Andreprevotia sp. IGB-42]|uniref:phage tail sheath family protein n=1 Tax=Andreprevotia sp. IGB-42 TaxID=2497473 RepID=UPI00157EB2DE|nr:phage tail sheath C-terminal domain-containing protein [Andreprevotia sp. IGB-42]KAF0813706.1 putative prophage major tail sheath protein [Andreprevotia sp. IGB-42]
MPVAVSYPGVYVQEIPSGVRTIVGVGTSIALFIGRAKTGALFQPEQCLSYEDFVRAFSATYAKSDLARAVKLFFTNGGTQAYVIRIADNTAASAQLDLRAETGAAGSVLHIAALAEGLLGNDIRVSVNYNTQQPEATFNLEVFRWVRLANGTQVKNNIESYLNLSAEPGTPRYVEDVINGASALIKVTDPNKLVALTGDGYSLSGYAIGASTPTVLRANVVALLNKGKRLRLSVNGSSAWPIDLTAFAVPAGGAGFAAAFEAALQTFINDRLPPLTPITVKLVDGPVGEGNNSATLLLKIASTTGDVFIEPAADQDITSWLQLGTAQGGIEVSRAAARRPAPTGVVTRLNNLLAPASDFIKFAAVPQNGPSAIVVAGVSIPLTGANSLVTSTAGGVTAPAHLFQDKNATSDDDGRGGVREKLGILAAAIVAKRASDPSFEWTAEVWGNRLALIPVGSQPDNATGTLAATGAATMFASPLASVRYYSLAAPGTGNFYEGGVVGNDGGKPDVADYEKAYTIADREIDLFNLLVLPRDEEHLEDTVRKLWGPASVFAQRRRAFLLLDPPRTWKTAQDATHVTSGVNSLRIGLVKDHSALFFPNLKVEDAGKEVVVGPSGAIAGLFARIDGSRGVWKAPAGTEADLRGVLGVQYRFSDGENGLLNPKAVNTIRVFPNGIVNWGARTMDGDDGFGSEYKYIPIRRLALYMEESLYRGLKWAVFEPNDEPLWAQIRLNVGAFMHNLFRQGAFQGATPREAYFVKCDASTTTQNDRNLGVVNVLVGFAPLKPAEFVVLSLQQIAGQIQT